MGMGREVVRGRLVEVWFSFMWVVYFRGLGRGY